MTAIQNHDEGNLKLTYGSEMLVVLGVCDIWLQWPKDNLPDSSSSVSDKTANMNKTQADKYGGKSMFSQVRLSG